MKQLIIALVLIFAGILKAGHPLISEDVFTIGKSKIQLEFTPEIYFLQDENDIDFPLTFSYGFNDKTDIIMGIPYTLIRYPGTAGPGDHRFGHPVVEIKYWFYKNNILNMAVKPGALFRFKRENFWDGIFPSLYLVQTLKFKNLVIHLNEGVIKPESDTHIPWNSHLSIAGEYTITPKWVGVCDFIMLGEKVISWESAQYILGFQYFYNSSWTFDIGYLADINQPLQHPALLFGITLLR